MLGPNFWARVTGEAGFQFDVRSHDQDISNVKRMIAINRPSTAHVRLSSTTTAAAVRIIIPGTQGIPSIRQGCF